MQGDTICTERKYAFFDALHSATVWSIAAAIF
jgi:hypothetical protein